MNLINNRMIIGASLLMMTFSLSITNVQAQTCAKVPTCAELGYTETSCPNGSAALKCPFDQTKFYCPYDCSLYPVATPDSSIGTYERCGKAGNYRYTTCNAGWYIKDGNCLESACTDYKKYNLTSNPSYCPSSDTCKSGKTTYYKCRSCDAGYTIYLLYSVDSTSATETYDTDGKCHKMRFGNVIGKTSDFGYGCLLDVRQGNEPSINQLNNYCNCLQLQSWGAGTGYGSNQTYTTAICNSSSCKSGYVWDKTKLQCVKK